MLFEMICEYLAHSQPRGNTMRFELEAACGSSIGRLRTNNEDNFFFGGETLAQENDGCRPPLFARFPSDAVCFGVFDGMGGADDGQVASWLAAQSFRMDQRDAAADEQLSEDFFRGAVEHMNTAVCAEAAARRNHMGTTAVMLGFCMDRAFVCNVGDSRAYRLREGRFSQLSMDHVSLRMYTRRKPPLSQCIGLPPEELLIEPYIAELGVLAGDVYLLCSDGLTDMVPEDAIAEILTESDAGECVKRLIQTAEENGGRDNITVIVVKVPGPARNVYKSDDTEVE